MTTPRYPVSVSGRRDLGRLQGEIQELLAGLWQVSRIAGGGQGFRPAADCFRTDDPPELVVIVDLAGVDPRAVEIVAADRTLVVSGERRRPRRDQRLSFRQMEIDYGPFQRRIALDEDVDPARATASYEQGLLTIVLPLVERPRSGGKATIRVKARS